MSEIETMCHEEYTNFLAYGDEVYEELDAATQALLELTCLDVPEEIGMLFGTLTIASTSGPFVSMRPPTISSIPDDNYLSSLPPD